MALQKAIVNQVNMDNPWGDDTLDRKKMAEYLTSIVASINQPFVVSLSSPYGTGKTYFIERWRVDLEQQGFKTAYFNAWESDFSNDVISAFINALDRQFATDENPEVTKKIIELAKKTGGFLRHKALPLLLKGLGRKLVGEDGVKETIEDFGLKSDEVAELLSSAAVEALSSQKAAEEAMEEFKDYLETLAVELTAPSEGEEPDPQKQKLIIFVDELDRCRPDYAIEVLEHIKHLFAVDGLVFVLSIDEDQIKSTIASVYGSGLNADGYLRRFIDWGFSLPKPSRATYTKSLIKRFGIDRLEHYDRVQNKLESGFHPICDIYGVSLRQMGQAFTSVNLAVRYALSCNIMPRYSGLIPMFAAMKVACPNLYKALQDGEVEYRTVFEELVNKLQAYSDYPPFCRGWEDFTALLQTIVMSPRQRQTFYEEYQIFKDDVETRIVSLELEKDSDEAMELQRQHFLYKHATDEIHNTSEARFVIDMIEGATEYLR